MNSLSRPAATTLRLPIAPYEVTGYKFGHRVRSRKILTARHLGDDIIVPAGTDVVCIGTGVVVWSEMRPGSAQKSNWGGVVIVEHVHAETGMLFYSVYGHITDIAVKTGDIVESGQKLGVVAKGNTPENGYWKLAHLHFGIYTGPWIRRVLPGYARPFEGRTRFRWWQDPRPFIESYAKHS